MDEVFIKDLCVDGIIGVYEAERKNTQRIVVNIRMFTQTQKAAKTDNIEDCVDYGIVAKKVQSLIENSAHFTVEALAEEIANLCKINTIINKVIIKVEKPDIIENAASVGVQIER
jgi:dihydroneopterin aldolase